MPDTINEALHPGHHIHNHTIHLCHIPQCTMKNKHKCAHFCSEWCILGYVTSALHCNLSPTNSTTKAYSKTMNWTYLNQCMTTHHDNGQTDGIIKIKAAKATKDDPQGKPSSVHKGTANEGKGTIGDKIENIRKNKTKQKIMANNLEKRID